MSKAFSERLEEFFCPVLDKLSESELKTHYENMSLRNLRAKVIRDSVDTRSQEYVKAKEIFIESFKELERTEAELRKRGISYGQQQNINK